MLIQNERKIANREELQVVIPVRIDSAERLRNLRLPFSDGTTEHNLCNES